LILRPLLQKEHRGGRAEHRQGYDADSQSRQPGAGLALHQFGIRMQQLELQRAKKARAHR